jgi:hypothetical protein
MATKQQIPTLAGVIVSNQGAFEALPTDDTQWAIENPEEAIALWIIATKNRNKTPIESPIQKRTLTPNKTIKYGAVSKGDLSKKVAKEQNLGDWAKDMMTKPAFTTVDTEGTADLVFLSLKDLGFTESPRTDEFMTAQFCADWSAKHLDGQVIELCLPEDGPHLRLQYNEQPKGEIVWMAMERITDSDGKPDVFYVKRHDDGVRWLSAGCAFPDSRWSLDYRVVFRLRKVTVS